jgi:dienelactone hydrolase
MGDSTYNSATQADQRAQLYALLGDLPERDRPISAQTLFTTERDGYQLETLLLELNEFEPVPAYFVKPLNGDLPFPIILYNHAHGGDYKLGKDELLVGRSGLQIPPYAQVLTQNGYAALCIDTWCFGERRARPESEVFKLMLWRGQVLWGMMIYDSLRAIDYLHTRSDVDTTRIGTMGWSMGSTMAWWCAALDERIKVCVDICCLTDYDALIDSRGIDGHNVYYYVPSLLKHFTAAQINALIAPCAHLSLNGNYDPLTPSSGLDRIDAQLKQVYADAGKPNHWRLYRSDTGHYETAAMRVEILDFLRAHL